MVVQWLKMSLIFLVCLALLFYIIGTVKSHEITVTEGHNICKDDLCLSENLNQSEKQLSINHNYNLANGADNSSEKNINLVGVLENSVDNILDKKNYDQSLKEVITVLPESTENSSLSTSFIKEHYLSNNVGGVEIISFTSQDFLNSTIEPDITKAILTSTIKLSITTTQSPFIASHSFLLKNKKKSKNVCFCDLQVNQCDINCCCDEDCTFSHYKVFNKCIDDNVLFDERYCHKTNFIFDNNSFHEVIQSRGGLFCIVKENAKVGLNYKTRAVLRSIEDFNKSLPKNLYNFSYKSPEKIKLINKNYLAGSPVWSIQKGELIPLRIFHSSVGFSCNSEINIKYLVDQVKTCFYLQQPKIHCKDSKIGNMIQNLRNTKIIVNSNFFNISDTINSTKTCKTNTCIGITFYWCESFDRNSSDCTKILKNSEDFSELGCSSALSRIEYQIWHNGSEGIMKVEAYLWVKKLPRFSNEFLSQLTSEVKYKWVGSPRKIFKRSGNPGYITGKPILAGRKVYNVVNGTSDKKEAIELSLDPKDWLSVLGTKKGFCSSGERLPVKFRENSLNMCSLKLNKSSFSKEKCAELQNNIFKLLIGNDLINETKGNFFNKFVATLGNSRIEETGDWVQVLIDLFPIVSSQTSFKSNHYHLMCKNIITDLHIGIVYTNIGSFLAPHGKILGVVFQLGKHKDLTYYCDTPGCEENSSLTQHFKLSSAVHFVDITEPAVDTFAEPLSLEAKLPHDFFYPFFSKSSNCQVLNKLVLIIFLFFNVFS